MEKGKKKNTDVIKEHHVEFSGRKADIRFTVKGFKECRYWTKNKIYDLEDWKFLNKLSQAIMELDKQNAK